jgi:hypothetical protein
MMLEYDIRVSLWAISSAMLSSVPAITHAVTGLMRVSTVVMSPCSL